MLLGGGLELGLHKFNMARATFFVYKMFFFEIQRSAKVVLILGYKKLFG